MEQLRSTRGFRAGKLVLAGKWGGAELSLADLEWVMRTERRDSQTSKLLTDRRACPSVDTVERKGDE